MSSLNHSMGSQWSRCFCNQTPALTVRLGRLQQARRPSFASFPLELHHRLSSPIAHRVFRSCSSAFPDRAFPNNNSTTTDLILFVPSCSQFRGPPCLIPTAGRNGRCRLISTPPRCSRRVFLLWTS